VLTALPRLLAPRALLMALLFGAFLSTGLGPLGHASSVKAGTAETMESQLLTSINSSRTARGLRPLYRHWQLIDLSGDRALSMATYNTLNHTIGGCLSCQLASRSIQHYSDGEVIGKTTYPWGSQAAASLFNAWKGSSLHWSLLMSTTYNYIGIGVAYNGTYKATYASIVMTEAIDQSRPWSRMASAKASGTTAAWTWSGADTALQTHTSGLRSFDVQYRMDSAAFSTVRSGTTATSLSLASRPRGHWYGVRVLSRDNRGYVSLWTAELRVWIP
jgi:uncharacterized protein YkwD